MFFSFCSNSSAFVNALSTVSTVSGSRPVSVASASTAIVSPGLIVISVASSRFHPT